MVWARLDDAILDNPKIVKAGPIGFALHVAAITWCSRNLTDGFLPEHKVKLLLPTCWNEERDEKSVEWTLSATSGMCGIDGEEIWDQAVKVLLEVGLWREDYDDRGNFGYRLKDFGNYNPTRAEVLEQREQLRQTRSDAGKAGAAKRWQTDSKGHGKTIAKLKQTDSPVPVPILESHSSLFEASDPDLPVSLEYPPSGVGLTAGPLRAEHVFAEMWAAKYKRPHVWDGNTGPKGAASQLINVWKRAAEYGDPELIFRHWVKGYLRDHDVWIENNSHSAIGLPSRVNRYGFPRKGPVVEAEPEVDPGLSPEEQGERAKAFLRSKASENIGTGGKKAS